MNNNYLVYRIYFWKQFSKCCIERKRFFLCRMTRWTYGIWVWDNWVKITGIKITGVNNLFSATIVIWFNYCYLVHRIYFSKYCMQRNIIFSTIVFLSRQASPFKNIFIGCEKKCNNKKRLLKWVVTIEGLRPP